MSIFVGHILQRYLRHKDYGNVWGFGCIGYLFVCKILDCFHSFHCAFENTFLFFCKLPNMCHMQTPYPLIKLFKLFRARPSSIVLKSLTNTRWCQKTKPKWLFPCVEMISMPIVCPTFKIDVLKMEQAFHTGYREGDKVFLCFTFQLERGGRISKVTHVFLELTLDFWEWEIWVLTSSLFLDACFLCGVGITSCRLGYPTLFIYMMRSPHGTYLLIPLSLTPLMGLLKSSTMMKFNKYVLEFFFLTLN